MPGIIEVSAKGKRARGDSGVGFTVFSGSTRTLKWHSGASSTVRKSRLPIEEGASSSFRSHGECSGS